MNIGSKYTKFKLDQFYTPLTLSEFISELMIKTAFQPRKLTVLSEDNLGIKDAAATGR